MDAVLLGELGVGGDPVQKERVKGHGVALGDCDKHARERLAVSPAEVWRRTHAGQ
jgi:hypothetical protein